jgi:hypothetical protein
MTLRTLRMGMSRNKARMRVKMININLGCFMKEFIIYMWGRMIGFLEDDLYYIILYVELLNKNRFIYKILYLSIFMFKFIEL